MAKIVAITGANGFIGTKLVYAFLQKGYTVKALVHHMPAVPHPDVVYCLYDLAKPVDTAFFQDVVLLIHTAFSMEEKLEQGSDVNITAIEALMNLQIPQYVFLSSFAAADPVTPSYYGTCKKKAESFFAGHLIVRPGLVIGNGGLCKRIAEQINKMPVLPLIRKGKQRIQVIFIDDLVDSILCLAEQSATGIVHLAHPASISYKELIAMMAFKARKRVYFMPVSVMLLKALITVLNACALTGFNKDNLAGLMADKYVDTSAEQERLQRNWLNPQAAVNAIATDAFI